MTDSRARTLGRRWRAAAFATLAAMVALKWAAPDVYEFLDPLPAAIFVHCATHYVYLRGWLDRHHQAANT